MEHGFYHPERGYWQMTGDVSQHILDGYPEGTVEVPLKPGPHHDWDGSKWVHAPPDPADILAAERAGMVVSRFQAKAALMGAGLLTPVEAAIAQSDALTQLAWAEAVELRRTSPMIAAVAQAIGLSDTDVDDLFRAAMLVKA